MMTMTLDVAEGLAGMIVRQLEPHCTRIAVAGSIRRKKAGGIKDVEIVCIPKPYNVGLFRSGIAEVVEMWPKVKGDLPCKYTQRLIPLTGLLRDFRLEGAHVKLDLFFANPDNWGLIYAIRTGSADYSHKVLATEWTKRGYYSQDGMLHNDRGNRVPVREEEDLFRLLNIPYTEPSLREYTENARL